MNTWVHLLKIFLLIAEPWPTAAQLFLEIGGECQEEGKVFGLQRDRGHISGRWKYSIP